MSASVATSLFAAFFATGILYFVCMHWVIRRLKRRHPVTYQAIGSPGPSWFTNWRAFRFFIGSRWKNLEDLPLIIVVRVAQATLFVSAVIFITLFVGL
jgi:hypothetical protein